MRQTGLFTSKLACSDKKISYHQSISQSISIVSLRVVREKTVHYHVQRQLTSPAAVADLLKQALNLHEWDREAFIVIPVDSRHYPCGINIAHVGTLTETSVHIREILKFAILVNATKIIVAHNHPSGSLKPSQADISLTKRLIEVSKLLDIPLLDHLIISHEGYFSFKEENLI